MKSVKGENYNKGSYLNEKSVATANFGLTILVLQETLGSASMNIFSNIRMNFITLFKKEEAGNMWVV